MGPVEGRAQRLVPGRGGPGAARQHVEHVVEPLGELPDRQHAHPGGGQLDGEGQAVQLAAELCHLGPVGVGDREVRCDQPRPVAEELNRLLLVKRRYRPGPLAFDAERLAAGGEDGKRGALGEQVLGQGRGRFGQVLAVVEHDQDLLVAAGGLTRGVRWAAMASAGSVPGVSGTPSLAATAGATTSASSSGASSTQATSTAPSPAAPPSASAVAAASASRVLPVPPGPVSVSRRLSSGRAGDRGQLGVPAHQRRQPHRKPSGGQHCHLVSPPAASAWPAGQRAAADCPRPEVLLHRS